MFLTEQRQKHERAFDQLTRARARRRADWNREALRTWRERRAANVRRRDVAAKGRPKSLCGYVSRAKSGGLAAAGARGGVWRDHDERGVAKESA